MSLKLLDEKFMGEVVVYPRDLDELRLLWVVLREVQRLKRMVALKAFD